jgi:hypothetical protein
MLKMWLENLVGRNHVGNQDIDGRITFEKVSEKFVTRM